MSTSDCLYDIMIIGCGPAGIAAGLELHKYPSIPKFLILEARDRTGGRTFTDIHIFNKNPLSVYYTPSDEDQIHDHFPYGTNSAFFDIDGTRLSESFIMEGIKIAEDLRENFGQGSTDKHDVSIYDGIRDKHEQIQDQQIRRFVDMYLGFIEQFEASNLNEISAKSFSAKELEADINDLALHTGYGSFLQQIVERNPLPTQLNSIVTNVNIPNDKNEPIRITTKDNRHYRTKYVLITIPLGCLKADTIKFTPSLPDWKQHAIDQMGFGLCNKIFMQFPSTFWDESLDNIFVASNDFRFFLCNPHDHMLTSLVCGNFARKLEQQTDEEIIEQIVQCLKPIYPQMPKPTNWLITRWGSDQFTYGAYSSFNVGATNETLRALATECYDDRVYWAGEHTNYDGRIGCVDSSFESSQRQTKRICNKLN
ncbi:unnamed protein product [Rotaria socialis]|uniref:Amine oxidase domain-containing protein n=1 Tax=Rotaria socialis TaxID=392032 RepID=A0A818W6G0_9BILA|nr:unnamed protein product [Rotaria socialis]CAF4687863.1 unnamed protein product [Rotaria socialis]